MQSVAPFSPVRATNVLAGHPALWLADRLACATAVAGPAVRPTGFAMLDAELPGGGWPAAGLTELLLAAPGSGELRLLAPMLAANATAGSLLWIAPPFIPYAPALYALGLALDRLVIVTPGSLADAAWAAEQGLRSGACVAVLWWQGQEQRAPGRPKTVARPSGADAAGVLGPAYEQRAPSHPKAVARPSGTDAAGVLGPACDRAPAAVLATALRRLHLAAQEAACPLFALRPAAVCAQSSPAPLRLALEPAAQGQLAVTVFKRRGPAMAAPLMLTLPTVSPPARRAARHALPAVPPMWEPADAVVRTAPERVAA